MWGWGLGDHKALNGLGDSSKPVQIGSLSNVAQVTAGALGGCARTTDGHVSCWGQVRSEPSQIDWPVTVVVDAADAPLVGVEGIAQAGAHTCAWKAGKAYCWGDYLSGQLGTGDTVPRAVKAAEVPGLTGVTSIVTGQNTTVVLAGGKAYCFGDNSDGLCGTGSSDGIFMGPNEVHVVSSVTKSSAAASAPFAPKGRRPPMASGPTVGARTSSARWATATPCARPRQSRWDSRSARATPSARS